MKRLFLVLAFSGFAFGASAQQCGTVEAIIEKATEYKRPYAYITRGDTLTILSAIYSAQTGHAVDPDRAIVIDIEGSIVVGIILVDQICGFMIVNDDEFAKVVRLAAFGQPV